MTIPDMNPLGYTGLKQRTPANAVHYTRDPTTNDWQGFDIGDLWVNTTTRSGFQLMLKAKNPAPPHNTIGTWEPIAGGTTQVRTLTPTSGVQVFPANGNINILGTAAQGVSTTDAANTVRVTVADATTTTKGVSQYDATQFNVAAGVVTLHGGLVLLGSTNVTTVGGDASVDFAIPLAYNNVMLVVNDAVPLNDTDSLQAQMSNDAGATWVALNYQSGILVNDFDSAVLSNANAATYFILSGQVDNGAPTSTVNGSYNFYGLNLPNRPYMTGHSCYFRDSSSKTALAQCCGFGGDTGMNALRIVFSTGNIVAGRFSLYGIRTS